MSITQMKHEVENVTSIPDFFKGKSVLITGATGFMGKVLVEKLLRSCPKVRKLYVLIRTKSGKDLTERVKDMTSLPLFSKIRSANKSQLDKIIPIKGDVAQRNLGISEEDRRILVEEVSIVFHAAASVRFDDQLKKAALMNTRGTLELIQLSKEMKKLEVFLHVSTTYCNTHNNVIEEKVYPSPANYNTVIKIAEQMDGNVLEVFSPKILHSYPNTYCFTKALAEQVVYEYRNTIPTVIFRPSIVISTLAEPVTGWVDNFNGPVGLMVAGGKGFLRTVFSDPDVRADYMPVDVAVKAMIVSAWHRVTFAETYSDMPVYNCSSYELESVTQGEVQDLGFHATSEVPLDDIIWNPGNHMTSSKLSYYIRVLLFHLIPALLIDSLLKLLKKPPILLKLQRKIFVANLALESFVMTEWSFKNKKLWALEDDLLDEDRSSFAFVIKKVDVFEYFKNCILGGRQFLLKEDNAKLPEAKKHGKRMYWIDKAVKTALMLLLVYLAIKLQYIQAISHYITTSHAFLSSTFLTKSPV